MSISLASPQIVHRYLGIYNLKSCHDSERKSSGGDNSAFDCRCCPNASCSWFSMSEVLDYFAPEVTNQSLKFRGASIWIARGFRSASSIISNTHKESICYFSSGNYLCLRLSQLPSKTCNPWDLNVGKAFEPINIVTWRINDSKHSNFIYSEFFKFCM